MRTEDLARLAAESARYRVGAPSGLIDVFEVIRALREPQFHLLRYPVDTESLDGAFVRREGGSYIFVNSSFYLSHQRFTAAHELGHAFLEPGEDNVSHFERSISLDRYEDAAANRFAAYFLMDADSVRLLAAGVSDPAVLCLRVMAEFGVSLPAASVHLKVLGLITEDDRQAVIARKEQAGSIARLARELGVKAPRNHPPDEAVDPGQSYLSDLTALRDAALVVPEQYEAMRTLRATATSA
jgi:Predicted Zn peptidase